MKKIYMSLFFMIVFFLFIYVYMNPSQEEYARKVAAESDIANLNEMLLKLKNNSIDFNESNWIFLVTKGVDSKIFEGMKLKNGVLYDPWNEPYILKIDSGNFKIESRCLKIWPKCEKD